MIPKVMTIEFEDHGQDFLEWDVKVGTGEILACRPYLGTNWVGKYVFCPFTLSTEYCSKVEYTDEEVNGKNALTAKIKTIKHPIKSIKYLTNKQK